LAGPGDLIGVGFLDHHIETARAAVKSVVEPLTKAETKFLAEADPVLDLQLSSSIERELDSRKRELTRSLAPIERVAGYLLCASQQNVAEGRPADQIVDSLGCGAVANLLNIHVSSLSYALLCLKKLGLIEECDEGHIRLTNKDELERVADGRLHS
jgi:CRP/FNR family transcriptional regulator